MEAIIISIGDELLIGQTVNTNASWMGNRLNTNGIDVAEVLTIKDTEKAIVKAIDYAISSYDVILITGGLGPTNDDVTKQVLCKYFNTTLVRNKKIEEQIRIFFEDRKRPILEVNLQQADLPEASLALENAMGTAPGMLFEKEGKTLVSMPGVPYEMKYIMEEHLISFLEKKYTLPVYYHRVVMTKGIGESFLADKISNWEKSLSSVGISLAYLPSPGIVKLRLTTSGKEKEELEEKVDKKIKELKELVPEYIFSTDAESLESVLHQTLLKHQYTVSTAESCTSGLVASKLTALSGSSSFYMGGVVSYSNKVKLDELHVDNESLEEYGAVSKQVVEQMALGIKHKINTDFAVATSGIAGPTGGSEDKPVGTVWVAVATPFNVYSKKFVFRSDRNGNVTRGANAAIALLLDCVNDYVRNF